MCHSVKSGFSFFSSRRRHTRYIGDWSSDVCSSDLDLKLPTAPVGIPSDFEEHVKLMFDLQVLAWQADITRISTFMLSKRSEERRVGKDGRAEGGSQPQK